jgi:hypothetical protein
MVQSPPKAPRKHDITNQRVLVVPAGGGQTEVNKFGDVTGRSAVLSMSKEHWNV